MADSLSPCVSVIVPVYDDPTRIRDTLTALTKQTYPAEKVDIFPTDNGPTDEMRNMIHQFEHEHENVTLVVEDEIQGSYAARNTDIEQVTGEIFAFVDADIHVDESQLETAVGTMDEAAYVECDIELVTNGGDTLPVRFDAQTTFPVTQYIRQQQYVPMCGLLVSRGVTDDVGPFDGHLVSGGDSEFGSRVVNAGYRRTFAPAATLYHPVRDSLSSLVKEGLHVGRGLCQQQEYYADWFGRPGIPPRPSGMKLPDGESSGLDFERLLFGVPSVAMTGVRALRCYREYVRYVHGNTR